MPLSSTSVGQTAEPLAHEADVRWLMAYAAGLGESAFCYLDTRRRGGIVPHPLFPVCIEWPVLLSARAVLADETLTTLEALRAVHASHDTIHHRTIRPGEKLLTSATLCEVRGSKAGALQVTRFDTKGKDGSPVCTTWYGTLYRSVSLADEGRRDGGAPELPVAEQGTGILAEKSVPIPPGAAHIYTECARIWNPIHTDPQVAAAAGLPGIILHGTASLALGISRTLEMAGIEDPSRAVRVAGEFRAMVLIPSEIRVQLLSRQPFGENEALRFRVMNAEGRAAVENGWVIVRR